MPTSQLDCLKILHRMERRGQQASVSALALKLGIRRPSVTQMLRLMSKKGWVEWQPRASISLSPVGKKRGVEMIRRHRILEAYLVEKVGLGLLAAHVEAEQLEHSASDDLIERLYELCGRPLFDPHGDPIPDQKGNFPSLPPVTVLAKWPLQKTAELVLLPDDDPKTLAEIDEVGLRRGDRIKRESLHVIKFRRQILRLSKACMENLYVRS